jgi:hypothetical protein
LLLGEWQEIVETVETVLFKQRVSAGEREAIERGFVGKANAGATQFRGGDRLRL